MGLDMYLYRRQYVGGWDFNGAGQTDGERDMYSSILDFMGVERLEGSPHAYVDLCVAYWRKANAIHGWFVNLAGGRDECQDIYVSREKLIELRNAANSVLLQPAMAGDILPPTPGFFFGSYDIDEWYMQDMKDTVEQIDRVLANTPEDSWADFFYRASW